MPQITDPTKILRIINEELKLNDLQLRTVNQRLATLEKAKQLLNAGNTSEAQKLIDSVTGVPK